MPHANSTSHSTNHVSPGLVNNRHSGMSHTLSILLSRTLETLLNQAIRLDQTQGAAFAALEDKVLAPNVSEVSQPLYLMFTHYGVSVQTQLNGQPDATLNTTLLELFSITTSSTSAETPADESDLANTFMHALRTLDIDWEEQLSHLTGDLVAFKIGQGVRNLIERKHSVNQPLGQTVKEYLQFELNALPTRPQVARFTQANHDTAHAVNALSYRIEQLLSHALTPTLKGSIE